MLAAPLTWASHNPNVLLLVQLPILAGLVVGLFALGGALGLSSTRCWLAVLAIGLAPAVLGYSVMLHFALAATAAIVWCLATYLRSDRLRHWSWSVGLGVAAGLLSVTRVVAVVYLAAVATVLLIDMLIDRTDLTTRWRNAAIAVAVSALISGPWWLIDGRSALRYLLDAGYDASTGFAPNAGVLTKIQERVESTIDGVGLVEALVLLLLLALWLLRRRDRASVLTFGTATIVLIGLASSSNQGTAFELPALALLAMVAATAVSARWMSVVVAVVVVSALAGQYGLLPNTTIEGRAAWVETYPGREQAFDALGGALPLAQVRRLNTEVADTLSGRRVVILRDDALLNVNSLVAASPSSSVTIVVGPAFGETRLDPRDLANVDAVIAGTTAAPYHAVLHQPRRVDAVLASAGFHIGRSMQLSADNTVVIWTR
jgi:hypothetical protein